MNLNNNYPQKGIDAKFNLDFDASNKKIAIVASRFNAEIINNMLEGSREVLSENGFTEDQIDIFRVPGAFELPLAVKNCAKSKKYDGIIALGCVIRGDTDHYVYVCGECTRGLMKVMLKENIPVSLGVLTTNNIEQAMQRADINRENKGAEVTYALLEMINLIPNILK